MRISNPTTRALTAPVALAMLAGCFGSSQMAPAPLGQVSRAATQSAESQIGQDPRIGVLARHNGIVSRNLVRTPSFMTPDAVHKPLIFVSNGNENAVDIYLQAGKNKMVGQITGLNFPYGMATDTARNLYVANDGSSDALVYAPPYTGAPALTLDDTGWFPYDVAVSPQGVVGVANLCNAPSCGSYGSITLYAKNATKPCATLANPNFFDVLNDGFDDKGNLYIDGSNEALTITVVGEISGGCNAKKIKLLTTMNTLGYPNGIKIDKADHIAVLDANNIVIDTYDRPKKDSLGTPISTTPLTGLSSVLFGGFAFRGRGSDVYVTGVTQSAAEAQEYDYPAGGAPENAITLPVGGPFGVAVTPPLVP